MISVEQALDIAFELARPLDTETIDLASGADRVLARAAHAGHDQPPFDASAMDGYAARSADCVPGARLRCSLKIKTRLVEVRRPDVGFRCIRRLN